MMDFKTLLQKHQALLAENKALKEILAMLLETGVLLVFKANIHKKFAVFDLKAVWYGSINLLSNGTAKESIMRLESPNIPQELMKDIRKSSNADHGPSG
jgi:hypothetical protein